jgi:peptidoglycan/LPS O-acetylase OafA/YrhL
MTAARGRDRLDYRADIDGLRAVAVILVILFHAFPEFCGGGFIGVDIFFVISGYLITGNILTDIRTDQFSYLDFYARRFRRIVPALVVVLGAVLCFGWFLLLPEEFLDLGRQVAAGSAFTSNILLLMQAGYFDTAAELKPLLHLWSLGIEEQYYIVWPAIMVLAYKTRLNKLAIISLLGAASFAFMLAVPTVDAFYLLPARFWELLVGGALAYCKTDTGSKLQLTLNRISAALGNAGLGWPALSNIAGGLAVILLAFALISLDPTTPYPRYNALLPTLAALLLVMAGPSAWLNRYILANRTAVALGLISYPLYLWHWPLLSFARIVEGGTPSIGVRLVLVSVAIILAWLTWTLVEIPVRKKLFGAIAANHQRKTVVGAAFAALALTFAASTSVVKFRVVPSNEIAVQDVGEENWYRHIDDMIADGALTIGMCERGDNCAASARHPVHFALYGDSHAEQLFPGLVTTSPHDGWLLLSRPACPPVAHLNVSEGDDERNCAAWNKRAMAALAADERIKTVVLTSLATPYFDGKAHSAYSRDGAFDVSSDFYSGSLPEIFYLGFSQTIRALFDAGKQVVLAVDNPELSFDLNTCVRHVVLQEVLGSVRQCSMPRSDYDSRVAAYREMIGRIKSEFPQLLVYDPTGLICDQIICSPWRGGRSLYRDQDHLSVYGSEFVAADLQKWLTQREIQPASPGQALLPVSGSRSSL